jgi:hypothetical protein
MPKRIEPLSENKVRAAKPMEKTYRLFDGAGLSLLVTPGGGKWWRFKYRFEGKEKLLALGTHPEISLEYARWSRDAARELLTQGTDPSALRKEEKAKKKAEHLEAERTPSIRVTIDGEIEIWKGGNTMRFTRDEARFITDTLSNIVR